MITTVIGAYPKPSFLKLPDWFKVEGGIDTEYPTEDYNKTIKSMGSEEDFKTSLVIGNIRLSNCLGRELNIKNAF